MKTPITIAIVDDNEIDLMIGSRLINRVDADVDVQTFKCGTNAVAWVKGQLEEDTLKQTVFLIDIYMPEYNGFQLVEELKKILKNSNIIIKFYLLSASIDMSDLRRVRLKNDIEGFIDKPISVELIKKMLEEVAND